MSGISDFHLVNKASKIECINRENIFLSLIKCKVTLFQYTIEEVLKEGGYE